ncbi:MAG: formate dehydrogenase accessory sulfurtransferase FdhD [Mycobacteriales bacterium]
MSAERPGPSTRAQVWTLDGDAEVRRRDTLVTEEPLEVRVAAGGRSGRVSVTMRTPGHDFELAVGFLHAEGLLPAGPPRAVSYCADVERPDQRYNVVTVEVDAPAPPEPARVGLVSSACGVCGSASLDTLRERGLRPVGTGLTVPVETLYGLPDALRCAQGLFAATGGLHAAGLFGADGSLLASREDVGRHNAVDKLVGWALLAGRLPLSEAVLLVSGRAGYEIVQKAVAAGIPVVASVSAPSSLAVAVAEDFGVTLVGFLRGRRCNVYAGRDRIRTAAVVSG